MRNLSSLTLLTTAITPLTNLNSTLYFIEEISTPNASNKSSLLLLATLDSKSPIMSPTSHFHLGNEVAQMLDRFHPVVFVFFVWWFPRVVAVLVHQKFVGSWHDGSRHLVALLQGSASCIFLVSSTLLELMIAKRFLREQPTIYEDFEKGLQVVPSIHVQFVIAALGLPCFSLL